MQDGLANNSRAWCKTIVTTYFSENHFFTFSCSVIWNTYSVEILAMYSMYL